MAGLLLAMLRVLCLKDALQATVTSAPFRQLDAFLDVARVVMNEDFWSLLFLLCRAVYPQLRILRLADQKVPAMDKLAYFITQADRLTPQFLAGAEQNVERLSEGIMEIIQDTTDIASEELDEEDDSDMEEDDVDDILGGQLMDEDSNSEEEEEEGKVEEAEVSRTISFQCHIYYS